MKFRKLLAMLIVFSLVVPSLHVSAATDDSGNAEVEYWETVINQGYDDAIYQTNTTDNLSTSNTTDYSDKRISGNPGTDVRYVVVPDYEDISNSYYVFNEPVSGAFYNYVTPIPTPTSYDEVSPGYVTTPVPTYYEEVSPGYVTTPEPTAAPTVIPRPTAYPNPSPTTVVVPNPSGIVYVTPVEKTPTKLSYNIDLEVGRLAHMTSTMSFNDSKTSSNTSILNDPRSSTGSFNANDYEARANKPGDATLTFVNNSEAFTEEWNVHVFCRPLDFEKNEYVVEKKAGQPGYITLYLKYFEYQFEYAYAFEWSSSDKSVAYLAGGDQLSTFARFCVIGPGVTIITVKDKYGNSSQCALVVKDAEIAQATPTPKPTKAPTPEPTAEPTTTPKPTVEPTTTPEPTVEPTTTPKPTKAPTPEPTVEPTTTPKPTKAPTPEPTVEPTATPKPTKTPKPTSTPTPTEEPLADGITEKQIKVMVKESSINLEVKQENGKLVLSWASDEDLVFLAFLDGYQVQVKGPGQKKFKTIKTVKDAEKLSFNFKDGVNKKKYTFRVRGYHINSTTGKKVYTKWSYSVKMKFKTKK